MSVYLIHFDETIGGKGRNGASHYVGFANNVAARLAHHRSNPDASIMAYLKQQGIGWSLVRIWNGAGKDVERKIKKGGHFAELCPHCAGQAAARRRTYGCDVELM